MANPNPNPSGRNTFSSENQPPKRGRKKNFFGHLAKENNLSISDIKNVYKNILTADYDKLDALKEKYPASFVRATIDVFKQEVFGTLTGRSFKVKQTDERGKPVEKTIQERVKSYDMARYMIDRIFGTPVKMEHLEHTGDISIGLPPPPEEADFTD
jgi:hypothetical protein